MRRGRLCLRLLPLLLLGLLLLLRLWCIRVELGNVLIPDLLAIPLPTPRLLVLLVLRLLLLSESRHPHPSLLRELLLRLLLLRLAVSGRLVVHLALILVRRHAIACGIRL